MNQLISVVNDIHDAFANVKMNVKLNLPQIAVVGSQSSGKSSVLESIVGKDFLPRGSGIVTRCPLVLQLVQLPFSNEEEWGEFLHKPGKKYFDFAEINNEIQQRTEEIAGKSAITDRPINLKVFSRKVLNLTLVDLPGLVMNAVGDQPKDIDRQIREMVTRYVSPDNTIILAISAANADLATSVSLRLARQLDPDGIRTVGVLTKLDLMDRGTDAFDILTGKVMPLRHGFVGVVNRSQHDINNCKSMSEAQDSERSFFMGHPTYSAIADTQGTEYLAKKLNRLLLEHIKSAIPDLKMHVEKLVESTKKQMEKLGMSEEANIDSGANMLALIKKFSDYLNYTIDGGRTYTTTELMGGARLDYIFHECFASYLNGLTAKKELTDEYIRINARNMAGMQAYLFPSDRVFVALSKQQVGRLEEPSLKCVQFVFEELLKIIDLSAAQVDGFPKLKKAIIDICRASLQEYRVSTISHVKTTIAAEREFINVKHPMMEAISRGSFLRIFGAKEDAQPQEQSGQKASNGTGKGGKSSSSKAEAADVAHGKMGDVPATIFLGKNMSEHEKSINDAIRDMVEGYFGIVKVSVSDQVPKAITLLMISKLREEAYQRLVHKLYTENNVEELLAQSPEVQAHRKAATLMMTALKRAQNALDNVRDFTL